MNGYLENSDEVTEQRLKGRLTYIRGFIVGTWNGLLRLNDEKYPDAYRELARFFRQSLTSPIIFEGVPLEAAYAWSLFCAATQPGGIPAFPQFRAQKLVWSRLFLEDNFESAMVDPSKLQQGVFYVATEPGRLESLQGSNDFSKDDVILPNELYQQEPLSLDERLSSFFLHKNGPTCYLMGSPALPGLS